jgi:hypothetical protein
MQRRSTHPLIRAIGLGAVLAGVSFASVAADIWVYSDRDFTGSFSQLSRSAPNLPTGSARSLRIGNGVWEACTGANYTGDCRRLTPGDYRDLSGRYGEVIMSVRDITHGQAAVGYAAPKIQLFEGRQYRGRTLALEQNVNDLGRAGFDDRASSAIVSGGSWEICTEYNFRGRCQTLPPGQYPDLGAQLDNRILSVRALEQPRTAPAAPPPQPAAVQVAPIVGAIASILGSAPVVSASPYDRSRVEIYSDPNFSGMAMTIDGEMSSLRNTGLNDRIQSMRVFGGTWEACENKDFGGMCQVFGPGDYRRLPPQLDRVISSLRPITQEPNWSGVVPSGGNYQIVEPNAPRSRHPLWLYEHSGFQGATLRAVGDVPSLGDSGFNDRASGMFISWGTWQLCEHANYQGRCFTAGPGQYAEMPAGMNDTVSSFRRIR